MTQQIRNIYCVGRNYRMHAEELGNAVPEEPMLFMKPTHAIVQADGHTLRLPGNKGQVHFEAELVLHIGRDYEPGVTVDELVDAMALGIDFTLRDVQDVLKKKGHPWMSAKGFLNAAPLGDFRPFPGVEAASNTDFTLQINGKEVQRGRIGDMIFSPQQITDFVAKHYGLRTGDIIYTGTPAGVGAVGDGDHFVLLWGEQPAGEFTVSLDNGN